MSALAPSMPASPPVWAAPPTRLRFDVNTRGVPVGPFPDGADPAEYDRLRRRVLWKLPMGLYVLGAAPASGATS